ncbi:hypothetical protein RAM19_05745 [Bartonella apihabitans]|nr:hypothetical protein [Bartonella apihabitans]WLT09633.1 hypothetical protein RAM19_05745 [Bartonella apihabitans]
MVSDNKVRIQTVPITLNRAFQLIDIRTDCVLCKWKRQLEKEIGTFAAQQRIEKCRPIVDDCVKDAVVGLLGIIYGKIANEYLGELRRIEKQEDALFSKT